MVGAGLGVSVYSELFIQSTCPSVAARRHRQSGYMRRRSRATYDFVRNRVGGIEEPFLVESTLIAIIIIIVILATSLLHAWSNGMIIVLLISVSCVANTNYNCTIISCDK